MKDIRYIYNLYSLVGVEVEEVKFFDWVVFLMIVCIVVMGVRFFFVLLIDLCEVVI